MSEELLPCPFCGAEAVVNHNIKKRVAINCENPECFAQQKGPKQDLPKIVKMWNRRTPPKFDESGAQAFWDMQDEEQPVTE